MAAVIFSLRKSLRRQRIFRGRLNPLDSYDDEKIFKSFRFTRKGLLTICDIAADLQYEEPRQEALPPVMQVMVALRFYATGTFQSDVGDV